MRTWVNESRNSHNVQDVIDCIKSGSVKVTVRELNDFIEWQGGHPYSFKIKQAKISEEIRILEKMVEEGY